jgi:hypothetical protein
MGGDVTRPRHVLVAHGTDRRPSGRARVPGIQASTPPAFAVVAGRGTGGQPRKATRGPAGQRMPCRLGGAGGAVDIDPVMAGAPTSSLPQGRPNGHEGHAPLHEPLRTRIAGERAGDDDRVDLSALTQIPHPSDLLLGVRAA